jgi:hypothetical protein
MDPHLSDSLTRQQRTLDKPTVVKYDDHILIVDENARQ